MSKRKVVEDDDLRVFRRDTDEQRIVEGAFRNKVGTVVHANTCGRGENWDDETATKKATELLKVAIRAAYPSERVQGLADDYSAEVRSNPIDPERATVILKDLVLIESTNAVRERMLRRRWEWEQKKQEPSAKTAWAKWEDQIVPDQYDDVDIEDVFMRGYWEGREFRKAKT